MTEHTNRANWSDEERLTHQRELDERRRQYDEAEAARKEQAEREAKQGQLEAHLRQRGERYQDLTGQAPSQAQLARWRDEYADAEEVVQEAERMARLDRAEDLFG